MALTEVVAVFPLCPGLSDPKPVAAPDTQITSNWVDVCTAPEAADNSGNTIINPGAITRAAQSVFDSHGYGTTLEVRLKYDDGVSVVTSPVVQIFGADLGSQVDPSNKPADQTQRTLPTAGAARLWQRLLDRNDSHELTLTVDLTNDAHDGTYKYTQPVAVDMAGCRKFLVAIKTAFAATGTVDDSVIQVRVTNKRTSTPSTVTATLSTVGVGATDLGKAEDAAHASGDRGVMMLGVRRDTPTALAADNDYMPPTFDSAGRLHARVGAIDAGETHIGEVGGVAARPAASATMTRPNDTTAYASGDLVANNTTAGSVTPFTLTVGRSSIGSAATGIIPRVKLKKSGTTATNASFRVHLFAASPTVTNGDNGAFLPTESTYLGAFDLTMIGCSDACVGVGAPVNGSYVVFATQTVYALIEARAAYTPAAQEVFTLVAEVLQN